MGPFGSPSHFLRQHRCPSHQSIESIMAHYVPSAEMSPNIPGGKRGGGGARREPHNLVVCAREDNLPWQVARHLHRIPLLSIHSPSFTLCLIRSQVSHHTHKSSPPPFQQGTLASPQMGKCVIIPKEFSLSASQWRNPSIPETFEFQSQAQILFLSFPCSQWIPPSFKSPASTGTVEKALIVKELLLYDPWAFSASKGNCSQVSTCHMQPLDTELRCKKHVFHQLWFCEMPLSLSLTPCSLHIQDIAGCRLWRSRTRVRPKNIITL